MSERPTLILKDVRFFERDVILRMPFRFGVVTLREAPQIFVEARIALPGGGESVGYSAEVLAPKWFDKSPDLTNEDNFDQLRQALAIAAAAYRAETRPHTAFGLLAAGAPQIIDVATGKGLPPLVATFGPALLDRAILDALTRHLGISIFEAAQKNVFGLDASLTPDLAGFDFSALLATLKPAKTIAARHTVGLVDPITAADLTPETRVGDGLPETLEEVVAATGIRHFKLKVGGDIEADIARLEAIAGVIDAGGDYLATLDGNEQYADVEGVLALWEAIKGAPKLQRMAGSIAFIEQPIARSSALERDIRPLAAQKAVEIDESDGTLDAFVEAKALGYTGVSSKSCKGFYRSLLNRSRCAKWNAEEGAGTYFMSAEDLTTQAGLGVQQDIALATLIGCTHIERNGHHYVDGMAALDETEQAAFLAAHPDLYHRAHGAVRVNIRDGMLAIGSLDQPGLASGALPDIGAMRTVSPSL